MVCLCNSIFQRVEFFHQFINFFFCELCFYDIVLILCLTQGHKNFLLCFLLELLWFQIFTFKSVIHFELIIVCGTKYKSVFIFAHRYVSIIETFVKKSYPFSVNLAITATWWLIFFFLRIYGDAPFINNALVYHLLELIMDKREIQSKENDKIGKHLNSLPLFWEVHLIILGTGTLQSLLPPVVLWASAL